MRLPQDGQNLYFTPVTSDRDHPVSSARDVSIRKPQDEHSTCMRDDGSGAHVALPACFFFLFRLFMCITPVLRGCRRAPVPGIR